MPDSIVGADAPALLGAPAADASVLEPMTAFIRRRLVKDVEVDGQRFLALAETEHRFNDTRWFWTDDNAKAAELLAEPSTYDADPAYADAAIDFVLRMSQGAVIQRRCGPAELRVLSTDPKAFRVETAFFIVEGDLSIGVVRHALRFNDGRTVTAAQHTGNLVQFRQGRVQRTVDVENSIAGYGLEVGGDTVTAWHESEVAHPASSWPRRARKPVGRLRYAYTVGAHRPSVTLRVTFQALPGEALDGLVLTTGLDQLHKTHDVQYRTMAVRAGGVDRAVRQVADKGATIHAGPAEYASVVQEGASPGFSYAIHTLLDGAKLERIDARNQQGGLLHWIVHRYRMGAVPAGGSAALTEERMVTGGGYYDALAHYEAVLRDGLGGGGADPSMTYDIGAELNAVAAHILFALRGRYARPPSAERLAALQAWYDRHLERYFDFIRPGEPDDLSRMFTRGIAFVALSLDCMLRATGEARYRTALDLAVSLVLRMGRRLECGRDEHDLTFGDVWAGHVPFLDNHASCVLALARAAWHGGDQDGALSRAVSEGILGIKLYSGVWDLGGGNSVHTDNLATINRVGHPHADTGFWNFKLGMVLRALHAAEHAADAGKLRLDAQTRRRLALRRDLAVTLLQESVRWHRDQDGQRLLEVLTARIAGETNSETQPWIALGLAPTVDEQIVALGAPSD